MSIKDTPPLFDIRGLIDFLNLDADENDNPFSAYFYMQYSTHPMSHERVARLRQHAGIQVTNNLSTESKDNEDAEKQRDAKLGDQGVNAKLGDQGVNAKLGDQSVSMQHTLQDVQGAEHASAAPLASVSTLLVVTTAILCAC